MVGCSSYPTSIITRIETTTSVCFRKTLKASYPTSIITRIETAFGMDAQCVNRASYPTSIITRIETFLRHTNSCHMLRFLPHFHYNKDWNGIINLVTFDHDKTSYPTSIITRIETLHFNFFNFFLYPSYPTSIITRIETYYLNLQTLTAIFFLPHFHYNKDWNSFK